MQVIISLLLLAFVESLEVGDVCETSDSCGNLMMCHEGRCTCSPEANMIPIFVNRAFQSEVLCSEKKKCDYRTKPRTLCDLGQCILDKGEFHGVCSCEEDSMLTVNYIDNKTCWPLTKRIFNTYCDHASPMCDEMKGLFCRGGKCLCKKGDMYNFTTEECISQKPYLEMFGLTKYQGRWGEYCLEDWDCLGILECAFNRSCECPFDCYGYIEEHNACYCGDWEIPTFPVIVGVFGGLLIICFWCYQINKLCKKFQIRPVESPQNGSQVRYEEVQATEEVSQPVSPENDPPPHYETTVASENQCVPSAPPLPALEDDRTSVNRQPVPLRKRKLPTSSVDPQHMKM